MDFSNNIHYKSHMLFDGRLQYYTQHTNWAFKRVVVRMEGGGKWHKSWCGWMVGDCVEICDCKYKFVISLLHIRLSVVFHFLLILFMCYYIICVFFKYTFIFYNIL